MYILLYRRNIRFTMFTSCIVGTFVKNRVAPAQTCLLPVVEADRFSDSSSCGCESLLRFFALSKDGAFCSSILQQAVSPRLVVAPRSCARHPQRDQEV